MEQTRRQGPATTPGAREMPFCDLVMKGGITSGVVYPKAVAAIAQHYRFQSIGGSSAGAIAAVLTAAAEYGRRTGRNPAAFDQLAKLPEELAATKRGRTKMLRLIQPQRKTAWLFEFLLRLSASSRQGSASGARARGRAGRRGIRFVLLGSIGVLVVLGALMLLPVVIHLVSWALDRDEIVNFRPEAILGLVAAAALVAVLVAFRRARVLLRTSLLAILGSFALLVVVALVAIRLDASPVAAAVAWWVTVSLLLLLLGTVLVRTGLSAGRRLVDRVVRVVTGNGFGLCTGTRSGGEEAIIEWVHRHVQRLSGCPHKVLTFGDLWDPDDPCDQQCFGLRESECRAINLEAISTNLTEGRAVRIPSGLSDFGFRPAELARVLPRNVVDHLRGRIPGGPAIQRDKQIYAFPEPAKLPVLLAARLSMSFPGLFTAVPLWRVAVASKPSPTPVQCWFSDGGITSNFPVHFFDDPLPRWPTFGINLTPVKQRSGGVPVLWPITRPDGTGADLVAFGRAILDTMQNWSDNEQLRISTLGERIQAVEMGAGLGGMNLHMDKCQIMKLAEKGRAAGTCLVERFRGDKWNEHRWQRYLQTMQLTEDTLLGFWRGWKSVRACGGEEQKYVNPGHEKSYETLLQTSGLTEGQRSLAGSLSTFLRSNGAAVEALNDTERLRSAAPTPYVESRLFPVD